MKRFDMRGRILMRYEDLKQVCEQNMANFDIDKGVSLASIYQHGIVTRSTMEFLISLPGFMYVAPRDKMIEVVINLRDMQ